MASCFVNVPADIRELRVRADAGFGFHPVLEMLEARPAQYAVVARMTQAFKRLLPGLRYEPVNIQWEMAEFDHRSHGWPHARHFVVARRFIPAEEAETTLFTMGRYMYRAVFDYRVEAAQNRPFGRGRERKLLLVVLYKK